MGFWDNVNESLKKRNERFNEYYRDFKDQYDWRSDDELFSMIEKEKSSVRSIGDAMDVKKSAKVRAISDILSRRGHDMGYDSEYDCED